MGRTLLVRWDRPKNPSPNLIGKTAITDRLNGNQFTTSPV